jgi:hypothetical protein
MVEPFCQLLIIHLEHSFFLDFSLDAIKSRVILKEQTNENQPIISVGYLTVFKNSKTVTSIA